ncbi:MAG TPA: hydrolase [Flavobacteriia bacterium]|jgi:hydroxymethylpyrimidine pyrophosphatase-like HAD family hydrolase|nr:hydrolase [Flavobacteriia bacterium]
MFSKNAKTIAIDFDGTIVKDAYPKIGKPLPFSFETLKKLQEKGNRLILWTYRNGKKLDEAIEFCNKNGITFYAINKSYPEEEFDETISRKIHADIFIDDRNFGKNPDWLEIHNYFFNKKPKPKKKGWFGF